MQHAPEARRDADDDGRRERDERSARGHCSALAQRQALAPMWHRVTALHALQPPEQSQSEHVLAAEVAGPADAHHHVERAGEQVVHG